MSENQKLLAALDADFEDVSEISKDQQDAEDEIKAAIDADDNDVEYLIKVFQITPGEKSGEWRFNVHPSELPIHERLRDELGGGKFELRVYRANRLFKRKILRIGKPLNAPVETSASPSDIAVLAQTMERNFQAMLQQMRDSQTQAANAASGGDPVQMMTALVGALASMKSLVPEPPKQEDQFSKFVDLYKMVKDMESGGNSAGSNVMDVIRDVVKSPLVEQIQKQAAQQEQMRGRALAAPGAYPLPQVPVPQNGAIPMPDRSQKAPNPGDVQNNNPSPHAPEEEVSAFEQRINNVDAQLNENMPNPPQNVASEPEEIDWNNPQTMAALTSYINYLSNCAGRGNTASLQAEVAWEQLEMSWIEMICDTPGIIDYLTQTFPQTAPHREWFIEYHKTLCDLLTEERNAVDTPQYDEPSTVHVAPDQTRPAGDQANIEGHGGANTNGSEEPPHS